MKKKKAKRIRRLIKLRVLLPPNKAFRLRKKYTRKAKHRAKEGEMK